MCKIALLFPGQGSQYLRMGKRLRDEFPAYTAILEEAGDVLECDLQSLVFDGSMEEITKSENAQPAIVATSYAFFEYYMETVGIEPDYLVGHSLGEISALLCSGVFSLRDAIGFVRMRGALMQKAFTEKRGHMGLVIGVDPDALAREISRLEGGDAYVAISGYNSPTQTLVSGDKKGIRVLSGRVEDLGGDYVPFRMVAMKVDAPYHCSLMDYAREAIEHHLQDVDFGNLRWPVVANVTALPYERSSDARGLLSSQLTNPVKWMQSLTFLEDAGVELGLEIGPGQVLRNLASEAGTGFPVLSIDLPREHGQMRRAFCVGQEALFEKLETCLKWIAGTRNHGLWDQERFSISVTEPYQHIERLLADAEKGKRIDEPTVCDAIKITVAAIEAKKTPRVERDAILRDLAPNILLRNRKFADLADLVADSAPSR